MYKIYTKTGAIIFLSCAILSGCEFFTPPPQMTSLQIQSIQSREFETSKKIAFGSVMTVFQDLGYIVNSAEYNTGFITAESPNNEGFFTGNQKMKATAFIEELDNSNTKIRLNFVKHVEYVQQNGGIITRDIAVQSPDTYQEAFTKIQEQIFIKTPFKDKIVSKPPSDSKRNNDIKNKI